MRSASGAVQTLLAGSSVLTRLHLYTLTPLSGVVVRWTDADGAVTHGGNTYASIPIRLDAIRSTFGVEVASARVRVGSMTAMAGSLVHVLALRGYLDGASLQVERCYLSDFSQALDPVLMFAGIVDEVRPTPTHVELSAKSKIVTLKRQVGRLLQPSCPYQVGDSACGVSLAGFQQTRTVSAGSTASSVIVSVAPTLAVATGWITFTSGALAGVNATIASVSGSTLTLALPLPSAPVAGDGITITRGCDKTRETCRTVFSNLSRFGGLADMPSDDEEV